MKRLLLFTVFIAAGLATVAQNNKVVTAYNYHRYYETRGQKVDDLMKAQEAIDEAIEHEQTMASPKAWMYRAKIYHTMYECKDPAMKESKMRNLSEAMRSYAKTQEYDKKNIYKKEIRQRTEVAQLQYVNLGVEKFENEDFVNATKAFESAVEVGQLLGKLDTLALYNAALAAEKARDLEKALEIYEKLLGYEYGAANTYLFIVSIYREMKNEEKAEEYVKRGRSAYPNDKNLIIEELNYYIMQGKLKEAINNLELAINADPTNHILVFSVGSIYDNMANPPKDKAQPNDGEYNEFVKQAEINYKKAIEIKEDYFDAYYNLGALYFNQAVRINDLADNIKDHKKFAEEQKKADAMFQVALPYLEKAHALNSKDIDTINSLRLLYIRTGDTENYKKMKELLGQ